MKDDDYLKEQDIGDIPTDQALKEYMQHLSEEAVRITDSQMYIVDSFVRHFANSDNKLQAVAAAAAHGMGIIKTLRMAQERGDKITWMVLDGDAQSWKLEDDEWKKNA